MIATLAWNSTAQAITTQTPVGDTTSTAVCLTKKTTTDQNPISLDDIKQRIADVSLEYGLDYDQLSNVIQCESQFNPTSVGDGGLAFGIAQFHKATFDEFCKGDYHSSYDQLTCMAQMFAAGEARHWSCFKRLYSEVIYKSNSNSNIQLAFQKTVF